MRASYVSLRRPPRQWAFSDYGKAHPTISVIETEDGPHDTGLIDSNETPIYRVTVREPVGFKGREKS